jgi:hypothetical protein
VGLLLTVVDALLFLSFEIGLLKNAMNIDHRSSAKKILDLDKIEMLHIQSIQHLLPQVAQVSQKKQLENCRIIRLSCNDVIKQKKEFYREDLKEQIAQRILRHVVTFIGALLVSAGNYYMLTSLLVFLNTFFLVSNPVGWGIIVIGLIASLALFLSMRGKAVVHMFVPEIAQYAEQKMQAQNLDEDSNEFVSVAALQDEIDDLKRDNVFLKLNFKKDRGRRHSF